MHYLQTKCCSKIHILSNLYTTQLEISQRNKIGREKKNFISQRSANALEMIRMIDYQ